MKRSAWVTGAIVLQFLLAMSMTALAVYLLLLTRNSEIRAEPDAVTGLKIAASIIAFPALAVWAGWFGMWKGNLWGWWTAFLVNLGLTGLFLYSTLDDGWHNIDWEMVWATVALAFSCLVLLLPPIRGFYWKRAPAARIEAVSQRE